MDHLLLLLRFLLRGTARDKSNKLFSILVKF